MQQFLLLQALLMLLGKIAQIRPRKVLRFIGRVLRRIPKEELVTILYNQVKIVASAPTLAMLVMLPVNYLVLDGSPHMSCTKYAILQYYPLEHSVDSQHQAR